MYEKTEKLNSGIDALLEINKVLSTEISASGETVPIAYTSRAIIKYDYSALDQLVEAGLDTGSASTLYKMKLYATDEQELPSTFTLEMVAVSGTWTSGLGRYDYIPYLREGVSWKYKTGQTAATEWTTASFGTTGATGSWNITPGGGNWYTSSALIVTKSISYGDSLDIEFDCTGIINAHLVGTIPNDGLILKKIQADETLTSDVMQLKFFSSDTNTIYLPHIRVYWDDSSFVTGSLVGISSGNDNIIYFKNLNSTYTTNDRVKFRLNGRTKYPTRTFSTSSIYAIENFLPESSSYSIEDLHTKEIVIPHDYTYTKINCDTTGSYFNFWMSGLQPERWYKFTIRTKYDTNDVRVYDDGFIFNVKRPNA